MVKATDTGPAGPPVSAPPAPLVFIVEDHQDTREFMADCLARNGFRVETARDGRAALSGIAKTRPDLIVTDLSLPHLNGWELTRRLRHDPRTEHIPVIACSAHMSSWSLEHALDAGCVAYLVKPISPEELLAAINRALARPGEGSPSTDGQRGSPP
jgi:CheY-like chemotaxis protein